MIIFAQGYNLGDLVKRGALPQAEIMPACLALCFHNTPGAGFARPVLVAAIVTDNSENATFCNRLRLLFPLLAVAIPVCFFPAFSLLCREFFPCSSPASRRYFSLFLRCFTAVIVIASLPGPRRCSRPPEARQGRGWYRMTRLPGLRSHRRLGQACRWLDRPPVSAQVRRFPVAS